MNIPNAITLDALRHMAVGGIAALPAEKIARLQDEADTALRAAKSLRDWLDGAIALRYADRATAVRHQAGKDTGTVRFSDGAVTIVSNQWTDFEHLVRRGPPPRRHGCRP